jgi:Protein kinase domain/FG-GAP-like repeat/FG-GAP repeat
MTRTAIGTYEVVRVIDRGGMAIVYEARQPALGRAVALKRLDIRSSDPSVAGRFIRESQIGASFDHPNIVTVFDFFEHDGVPHIAMEYLPRGSLRPWLPRLTLSQVCGVLEGMLAALAHAEQRRVAHRDLKPENVLITQRGGVKIADFGIAKAYTRLTRFTATGVAVGTPAYMAPEQALAQRVGPWTDLYSLGVMAFEMLSGATPFGSNDTPMAIMYRHVGTPPPPLTGVDPRLAAWVARLLEKLPERRPQSATEAWGALEEIVVDLLGPYWRRDAALVEPREDDFVTVWPPVAAVKPAPEAPAPVVVAPAPQIVEPAPQIAEPAPQIAEPVPQVVEPVPQVVEPAPVLPPTVPPAAAAVSPPPRRPRRRRTVAAVAACAAAVLAAAGALALAAGGGGGERDPSRPQAAAPYDFDGDGRATVVAGMPENRVVVLPGSGEPITGSDDEFGAAATSDDFDRDGRADLAVGSPGDDRVTVRYGGGRSQTLSGDASRFGAELAAGDLNGDGFADLVVGAPGGTGSIELVFGGPDGLGRTRTLAPASELHSGFGRVLALGDIDRDGDLDLVEGAPGDHGSFCAGRPTGPRRCQEMSDAGPASLAVGDVTGDRFPDIVQGHPDLGLGGSVLVWPGFQDGPAAQPIVVTQDTPGVRGTGQFGDRFGSSVVVGAIDDDGFADMVVAAPGEDDGAGRVTLVRGGGLGSSPGGRALSQASPGMPGQKTPGYAFGESVTLLDGDGDGRLDLTVAVPGEAGGAGALITVPGNGEDFDTRDATMFELGSAVLHPEIRLGLPD